MEYIVHNDNVTFEEVLSYGNLIYHIGYPLRVIVIFKLCMGIYKYMLACHIKWKNKCVAKAKVFGFGRSLKYLSVK